MGRINYCDGGEKEEEERRRREGGRRVMSRDTASEEKI